MHIRSIFILMLYFLNALFIHAQNLDNIGKKDMLKVNGGLNYSSVFYNADGIANRRQPFTYFVNGNINASVLDIHLPFTFNYSNHQINYSQPCYINSFNPTYKWIKGYAGITSMNFSPYTMAGHIFTGAGFELNPKNFRFAALYGKFKNAQAYDTETNSDLYMSYKRMGWGATTGYEKNGQSIKLIYFSAKDDHRSLSFVPVNTNITPMENTVVSLAGKLTLLKQITVDAEYALSGLTRNTLSPAEMSASRINQLPMIFQPNATSQFFSAYKGSVGYRTGLFGINFNYERIDPDYKTLGAYYFNNDLENFTLAPTLNLLKGKLNISINSGLQRNNLNNDKLNSTKRWVGSYNVNYVPNTKWNFSAAYSNFSTFTRQRPQDDPFYRNTLDTLNFYQLTQNANAAIIYSFGNKAHQQNIMLNANYMVSGQQQGKITDPGIFGSNVKMQIPSKTINMNLAYNLNFTKSATAISTAINLNHIIISNQTVLYYGPNFNLSKALFNKLLKLNYGISYNQVLSDQVKTNEVFSHRIAANCSPKTSNSKAGKINLSLSAIYLQKISHSALPNGFNEFTGNLALSYHF